MSFFGHHNRNDNEERITETEQYSTDYDRGYGGRGPREDERFTETTTSYSSYGGGGNGPPPPPQVPYPWRPHWDDRERRYIFVNEQSGERTWEFPGRQGYGGGGSSYQSEEFVEQRGYGQQQPKQSGGHGMLYAGLAGAAGLAGGALLMHEGDKIGDRFEGDKDRFENRFEEDKYRVENDVEDFPENAANWTGRKVGEVEDIPQDIEQGFDRFGNKIEDGFEDVVDAPERVAGWAGDKVGDVERYGDNIDNAYDQGRDEERYDDGDRNDRW